ncbi:uncharacterized protein LOC113663934 isoform X2 [Tachysurus fulvidraco]|uniref:uncharacterized protein LOC113663934 isoform X2 n=1 Tax=Tachysurus fulvidraco TaxID=1234273 RepID=UPI001FEDA895|nr:uncharacterized protein LOC113663934 isoform X2 [Tachysurus fulvidraco]
MQHPNDGVPCDRGCSSTTSWSFSVSQGLHLHVSDRTTASSSKALRKYDFRLLTPSTGGTFHRRGLAASGTSSSVTQKGRSLMETPGYSVVWRHRDPADCPSTGNPVLHLYLPDYRIDPRKETDEASDAETDQKTGEIRSQPQEKEGAADVLEDVMTTETGSEQKCNVEENDERRRSGQNELDEIEMNKRGGVREESPDDITQEPGEKRSTEHSGKSDDRNQCAADVFKERPKAPDVKLKSKDRNSGQDRTRRPTLPASALFIPGTLGRTRSSPSSCMLPPFYGSSFGHSIRTPHTPERHRAKTHLAGSFSFDKRAIKSVTQKPPSWDSTGNRLVFKTEPRGITGPRPKILSCERWGPLPRKTKTTKTFVWGPRGPQESKSVCELHARTNRWRGED